MRSVLLLTLGLSALTLTACASLPDPVTPNAVHLAGLDGAPESVAAVAQSDRQTNLHQAQLDDIREAEARLDLARARLDLATVRDRGAEDSDVREFLAARRSLRDLRNVYGPTETGREAFLLSRYGLFWPRRYDRWSTAPVGTFGLSDGDAPNPGAAMPLSGASGN